MTLKCTECENTQTFTATAQAAINVEIDGNKQVINSRPGQQTLDNLIVMKPWKCNVCGAANKIIDTDTEEENEVAGEIPQD